MSKRLFLRALGAALLLGVMACARRVPELTHKLRATTDLGGFEIHWAHGDDAAADRIRAGLATASRKLSRWGALRQPVRVFVMPDHDALEAAVERADFPWLKAWARYDEIFIQSPRTWGFLGGSQPEVEELLVHELTHCVMYQTATSQTGWRRKRIPLWFREGMASVTAQQGYRWADARALLDFSQENPALDPVGAPEALYQGDHALVYGSAHLAFSYLVQEHGDAAVRKILSRMNEGRSFVDAFHDATTVDEAEFRRRLRAALPRLAQPHPATPVGPPLPDGGQKDPAGE